MLAQGEGPHKCGPSMGQKVELRSQPFCLLAGGMIISSDFRLLKIMHAIQTICSGSADSDEKGASSLTPAASNCLRMV